MYTSKPTSEVILNIIDIISFNYIESIKGLKQLHICNLLEVLIASIYLTFQDQNYKQIGGLPMGYAVSILIAILFMDTLEKRALANLPMIQIFKRYVDDCFFMAIDQNEAQGVTEIFNGQYRSFRFEYEQSITTIEGHNLSLPNFTITMTTENGPTFDFYTKSVSKDFFVIFNTFIYQRTQT